MCRRSGTEGEELKGKSSSSVRPNLFYAK
ncbi:hypothetical protein RRG08_056414, partial [Elysia crispata]